MRELDDCGAIGAALIKAYRKKADPRYRAAIDVVAEFISKKMTRLPDGTLARKRPQWPTVWSDDAYMSIPFLAQMGDLTGDRRYFDDATHQVIKFADYLMSPDRPVRPRVVLQRRGFRPARPLGAGKQLGRHGDGRTPQRAAGEPPGSRQGPRRSFSRP